MNCSSSEVVRRREHIELEEPKKLVVPGHARPIEFGVYHSFSYQLEGSSDPADRITVATTRIETMLGNNLQVQFTCMSWL